MVPGIIRFGALGAWMLVFTGRIRGGLPPHRLPAAVEGCFQRKFSLPSAPCNLAVSVGNEMVPSTETRRPFRSPLTTNGFVPLMAISARKMNSFFPFPASLSGKRETPGGSVFQEKGVVQGLKGGIDACQSKSSRSIGERARAASGIVCERSVYSLCAHRDFVIKRAALTRTPARLLGRVIGALLTATHLLAYRGDLQHLTLEVSRAPWRNSAVWSLLKI